jgi:hypothetical protein
LSSLLSNLAWRGLSVASPGTPMLEAPSSFCVVSTKRSDQVTSGKITFMQSRFVLLNCTNNFPPSNPHIQKPKKQISNNNIKFPEMISKVQKFS